MTTAEIIFVSEIIKDPSPLDLVGRNIRLTGIIKNFDGIWITIYDPEFSKDSEYTFQIDSELSGTAKLEINCLAQFIGEIQAHSQDFISNASSNDNTSRDVKRLYMKANIVRNVQGLDYTMMKETILLRREFINKAS